MKLNIQSSPFQYRKTIILLCLVTLWGCATTLTTETEPSNPDREPIPLRLISLNIYGHKTMSQAAPTYAKHIKQLAPHVLAIQEGVQDWNLGNLKWPTDYSRAAQLQRELGQCWERHYQIFINRCQGVKFINHYRWDLTDGNPGEATRTGETAIIEYKGRRLSIVNLHWEAFNRDSRALNAQETVTEISKLRKTPAVALGDFNTSCSGHLLEPLILNTSMRLIVDAGIDCIFTTQGGQGYAFKADPSDHPGVFATIYL